MSIYLGNTLMAGSQPNAANKDLSNVSVVGQKLVAGWGMPNYNAGITISSDVNTAFTRNGYVSYVPGTDGIVNAAAWNSCIIRINGKTVLSQSYYSGHNGTNADAFMCPVGAGDTILVTAKTIGSVVFYPCKGEN